MLGPTATGDAIRLNAIDGRGKPLDLIFASIGSKHNIGTKHISAVKWASSGGCSAAQAARYVMSPHLTIDALCSQFYLWCSCRQHQSDSREEAMDHNNCSGGSMQNPRYWDSTDGHSDKIMSSCSHSTQQSSWLNPVRNLWVRNKLITSKTFDIHHVKIYFVYCERFEQPPNICSTAHDK